MLLWKSTLDYSGREEPGFIAQVIYRRARPRDIIVLSCQQVHSKALYLAEMTKSLVVYAVSHVG